MFTMGSTQISYKYYIYAHLHINTIFMHTVDFESDSWLYRIFEIYHVKYTDICSILYLDTFSVHLSVKSHVYHVNNTDFI